MQRLQGWVRYAAQQLPVGAAAGIKPQQQQHEEDEEDFIYGRVAVHSDDEEPGDLRHVMSIMKEVQLYRSSACTKHSSMTAEIIGRSHHLSSHLTWQQIQIQVLILQHPDGDQFLCLDFGPN